MPVFGNKIYVSSGDKPHQFGAYLTIGCYGKAAETVHFFSLIAFADGGGRSHNHRIGNETLLIFLQLIAGKEVPQHTGLNHNGPLATELQSQVLVLCERITLVFYSENLTQARQRKDECNSRQQAVVGNAHRVREAPTTLWGHLGVTERVTMGGCAVVPQRLETRIPPGPGNQSRAP